MITQNSISTTGLRLVFAAGVFAVGGYYELCSALISAALCALLFLPESASVRRVVPSSALAAALLISLFYFLSSIWAVDSAMALWGGVKYLPVLLWALCLSSAGSDAAEELLGDLPVLGAVTTVLSYALQFIPSLRSFFIVGGRLAGFFSYPNSFACFLLLAAQLLLFSDNCRYGSFRPLLSAALGFGLAMSASRAVLTLAVVSLPFGLVIAFRTVPRYRKALPVLAAGFAVGILLAVPASMIPAFRIAGHLSAAEGGSTLYGRLLYWYDAVPRILKNPFGMGYLGYYMSQASFQTGIYSVRWAHNDLVQLLLDVGWLPAAVLMFAVLRRLLSKETPPLTVLMLITLCAHCLFDFDLEFISMYALLFLLLGSGSDKPVQLSHFLPGAAAALLCLFSLYVGIVSTLTYRGEAETAAALYPGNTLAETADIFTAANSIELEARADSILSRNAYAAPAFQAKAMCRYSEGDFAGFIKAQERAIAAAPYELALYEDYFRGLASGVELYLNTGDSRSALLCLEKIHGIGSMLDALKEKTSPLAYMLNDKPSFTLSPEYYEYIAANPLN